MIFKKGHKILVFIILLFFLSFVGEVFAEDNHTAVQEGCNVFFDTVTDKLIYERGDSVKINHIIKNYSGDFEISYWIEDLYGEVVKSNFTTGNTNQKTWTASSEGEVFFIKSLLIVDCNNSTIIKNSSKVIFLRDEIIEEPKETAIAINNVHGELEFGKTFYVDLNIKKADTLKYSINAYVKGNGSISDSTTVHARGSNLEYVIRIPLTIKNNCEKKYQQGNYSLVVEGLGSKVRKNISVKDKNYGCFEKIVYKYNETCEINQSNKTESSIFYAETNRLVYGHGDSVKINHYVDDKVDNLEIDYWIEDINGNLVKAKLTSENTNQKVWTINEEGEVFFLKSVLKGEGYNETIEKKHEGYFFVENNVPEDSLIDNIKTGIDLVDVDKRARFGDIFDVDILISKGDTRKYSINLYVEGDNRISQITNIHARGSNKEYRAKVPVVLNNNCNGNYDEGIYTLVIEGLGSRIEKEINVIDGGVGCTEKIIKDEKKVLVEPEPEAGIRSFYTLNRNYNDKINLYASFKNINGTENVHLKSIFGNETIQIQNNSRIKFEVEAQKGENLYVLDMEEHDTKYLYVSFPGDRDTEDDVNNNSEISNGDNKQSFYNEVSERKEPDINSSSGENDNVKNEISSDGVGIITGKLSSIYKSSAEKSQKTARYALVFTLLISLFYLIFINRRKLYKTPAFFKEIWPNKK